MKINILVVAILACLAIPSSVRNFTATPGMDFYQFWGISKARLLSDHRLKSPYKEHAGYAGVLTAEADRSSDERLKKANGYFRHDLDPAGTPLFYAMFSLLPVNYSLSFGIYQTIQIVLFVAAIFILGVMYNGNKWVFLSLALLLVLIYEPFLSDLRVGNFNSIQLFVLVLLILFAERLSGAGRKPFVHAAVFMCALVFVALLKPNLSLVMLLLAVHLWAVHGTIVFSTALAAGVLFCMLLVVLTCIQFDSWSVWLDWYYFLIGADSTKLFYPVSQGNYAPVLLVSGIFNKSNFSITVIIACALLFSVLSTMIMTLPGNKANSKGLWQSTVRSLRDPHLVAALGITATLALSPLVWLHYYILSLIPALWLLSERHPWKYASTAGGLSILLTSNVTIIIYSLFLGWSIAAPYGIASGLVPLWCGVPAALAYGNADIDRKNS